MKTLTILEMGETDCDFAQRIADGLGGEPVPTAYCSGSDIPGLYIVPSTPDTQRAVIVKTAEFGFMVMATLRDCELHALADEQAERLGVEG